MFVSVYFYHSKYLNIGVSLYFDAVLKPLCPPVLREKDRDALRSRLKCARRLL